MEEQMITTTEETVIEEIAENNEGSGLGTGMAMLIGSGLTLAAMAGVKFLKKKLAERKAMKEMPEVFDTNYDEDFCEEENSDSDEKKTKPEEEKKD